MNNSEFLTGLSGTSRLDSSDEVLKIIKEYMDSISSEMDKCISDNRKTLSDEEILSIESKLEKAYMFVETLRGFDETK